MSDSVVGEQRVEPADEVVEVGYVRHHVVRDDHIGGPVSFSHRLRALDTEESDDRRNADRLSGRRGTRSGVDAQRRHTRGNDVAEEVPVVAGHFNDE